MNMGRDNRPECRYGAGCYQKNPDHKNKFKHPDKNEDEKENKTDFNPDNKKRLAEEDSNVELEKKVRHDMSSEEESSDPEVTETSNENKENSKTLSKDEVFNDLLPISPQNVKDEVKQKFLLGMPEDFYDFHQFCKSLDQNNTNKALSSVGLELGGPFEVLSGTIPTSAPQSKQLYESHHRYYYDPPEMQTVIVESKYKTGLHIGYFRDIPEDLPVFVCSSVESEGPRLCPLGDNLFSGLYNHLASKIDNFDPFTRTKASALMEKIKLWVNKSVMEGSDQLNLERKTAGMKNRDKKKVIESLALAIEGGLYLPLIYNTSSYDSLRSLHMLDGLVDIYLPDFKFWSSETSARLCKARDYPVRAREAILEMHKQVGDLVFDENGLAKSGLLVRHLAMPGLVEEGKTILSFLREKVSPDTYLHIMEQYRPTFKVGEGENRAREGFTKYEEIGRPMKESELDELIDYARSIGLWRREEHMPLDKPFHAT